MTLSEIEKLAKDFSDARSNLKELLDDLERETAELKKRYLPQIRRAVERAAQKKEVLRTAIEEAPELFVRPKTVIFHGIKLGYQKAKGEIHWENEAQVIRLIKKHFPDDWETYVKVTERVLKTSLAQLSAADLKKLGVTVVETGDEIVIKPTDSEVDRMIDALLREEPVLEAA